MPENVLSRFYTFAIMWSIAAVLESSNRLMLENFIKTELRGKMSLPSLNVTLMRNSFAF